MKKLQFIIPVLLFALSATAQRNYWQQHVNYKIAIEMDVEKHQFSGTQELTYTNNSPDTIRRVFYHLYYNAFQEGSMMAVRASTNSKSNKRINNRFSDLKQDEIGYQKVTSLEQDGQGLFYQTHGTILEVELRKELLPGQSTTFSMTFNAQIPVMIRRTGRNNSEDIDYTMTQWYPKLAEYDEGGWHPYPYIAREFYGVFGDFDVKITIPKKYVLGGTGVLQNPEKIGHGYIVKKPKKRRRGKNLTWHFKAEKVHDFAWAADQNFTHRRFQIENGPEVHLFYNPDSAYVKHWENYDGDIKKMFSYMEEHFGKYPYPQFSFIQGGDGGMEYPMCTMMLGADSVYDNFLGLYVHESLHNWYYGVLASNEQLYPWMDEGFTSFAQEYVMNYIKGVEKPNAHLEAVAVYLSRVEEGLDEPMSTPADHFRNHHNQSASSYYMGELFLVQLKYILGDTDFNKAMKLYFERWKFKHPKPSDVIRVMEDVSGMQLDWFLTYWTQLTKTTDYAIKSVDGIGPNGTVIKLENLGERPMPVDVKIVFKDGSEKYYTIPLLSMFGAKSEDPFLEQKAWPWVNPYYDLHLSVSLERIHSITIDPMLMSCDVNMENNRWQAEKK